MHNSRELGIGMVKIKSFIRYIIYNIHINVFEFSDDNIESLVCTCNTASIAQPKRLNWDISVICLHIIISTWNHSFMKLYLSEFQENQPDVLSKWRYHKIMGILLIIDNMFNKNIYCYGTYIYLFYLLHLIYAKANNVAVSIKIVLLFLIKFFWVGILTGKLCSQ